MNVHLSVCYEIEEKFCSFMLFKMWWKRINCNCDFMHPRDLVVKTFYVKS